MLCETKNAVLHSFDGKTTVILIINKFKLLNSAQYELNLIHKWVNIKNNIENSAKIGYNITVIKLLQLFFK